MPKSLQGRSNLLFLAFALLVLVSVGATVWGLEGQRQDFLTINLAGRQRMLAQQMARLAFEAGAGEVTSNATLQQVQQTFDQTQRALLDGGTAPYQPDGDVTLLATRDPGIRLALNQANGIWSDLNTQLDGLQQTRRESPAFASALQSIQQQSTTLAGQTDAVVRMYQAASAAKVNRLRAVQIVFLAAALILLGLGMLMTQQSILKPLRDLRMSAAALAENDLNTAIRVESPEEIRALSQAFETVRLSIGSSRQELMQLHSSLEEHIARRTRELELLNDISRDISSRLDIQQVLNSVTEKARSLLGGEVASLCLMDENRHWLRLQAISGPRIAVDGQAVSADGGLTEMVLASDQALVCGVGNCHGSCRILSEPYRMSHMAASLRVGDQVIGALCVGSLAPNRFAEDSAALLTKLANTAAIALENARLYAQAERVATLEERHRVAAEMHDGLGQTLSYLGLMTDQAVEFLSTGQDVAALGRLGRTREAIGKASGELRRAIDRLMDESPSESDLCRDLQIAVAKFEAENDLKVGWQAEPEARPRCSRRTNAQVLNITLEALNNVAHHAQAQHVQVRVGHADNRYSVTVEDDGRGFDPSKPEPSGHFGLQIMQTRAAHIGGHIQIESEPGSGTRVTLTWPMEVME